MVMFHSYVSLPEGNQYNIIGLNETPPDVYIYIYIINLGIWVISLASVNYWNINMWVCVILYGTGFVSMAIAEYMG